MFSTSTIIVLVLIAFSISKVESFHLNNKKALSQFADKEKRNRYTILRKSNSDDDNDFAERLESIKASITSLLSGSITMLPVASFTGIESSFNAEWQITHLELLVSLLLFGITYRYVVRNDDNDLLKQGAVNAFALVRALALVEVSSECLVNNNEFLYDCGQPLHLFTLPMFISGSINLLESLLAFGGAALFQEFLFNNKILKRFPSR